MNRSIISVNAILWFLHYGIALLIVQHIMNVNNSVVSLGEMGNYR